jgi:hypothetical protein
MANVPADKENRFDEIIAAALAKIPADCIDWVLEKITFVRPEKMKLAHAIGGEQLKYFEGIIVLFDELLEQTTEVQEFAVLHEIADIKLQHKLIATGELAKHQEAKADELAKEWLNSYEKAQSGK